MLDATNIRVGNVIAIEGHNCKVLHQEIKGTGKFGKTVHMKLRDIESGHISEKSLRAEEKVEEVYVHKVKMQYSYKEGDDFIFMNMETYEQFPVNGERIGKQSIFLKENSEIDVEFLENKVIGIDFPKTMELVVSNAPPATKGANDSTYKEVELENGIKTLVPQFIKEGDLIKIDTETFEYLERHTKKSLS